MLRRIVGACCDKCNATSAGRWAGGCRRDELMPMMIYYGIAKALVMLNVIRDVGLKGEGKR